VTEAEAAAPNRYDVREVHGDAGWAVEILDPGGNVVWTRACGGEEEARTFASVIRQHASWLSEGKFQEYYRIA
jgi:hypothetical protein